jgi:hypothetical protein
MRIRATSSDKNDLIQNLDEKQKPVEDLFEWLGQRDDDALGAAEVTEPLTVLEPRQIDDEFGAMEFQAGNGFIPSHPMS